MPTNQEASFRRTSSSQFLKIAQRQIKSRLSVSLKEMTKDGRELTDHDRLAVFRELTSGGKMPTFAHLLPLLLNLRGKPYSLVDHFPFEPMFRVKMTPQLLYMTGRQTSKSTSNAASEVVVANAIPFFNTLTITPLFEQIRRFSGNYVRPFIEQSPVKSMWVDSTTIQSILQKTFRNFSNLFFSFALLDAERVRGLSADRILYDEVQDLDKDHIPIIREVMSHSKWEITQYTGTPKSRENTIEGLWQKSSQAQWCTPCFNCKHDNYACSDLDLYKMIGPYREDISMDNPATICAKCAKAINPRNGRWVHKFPERRWKFPGYHIPQVIMPIHYAHKNKWATLLAKQGGAGGTTPAIFHNEVLGESYDIGAKLVTKSELQAAAQLHENTLEQALAARRKYEFCVLGVDWGGGGEEEVSFTTLCIACWNSGVGKIDIIYGEQLFTPNEHVLEAQRVLQLYAMFNASALAHDYTGAGSLRETFLIQSGMSSDKLMPIAYVRSASQNILNFVPATLQHPKNFWRADKSRSLQLLCHCVKMCKIRFFKFDEIDVDRPGLLCHFLALTENKIQTSRAGEIYTIQRNPMLSDDFAQACNLACMCVWHSMAAWPFIANMTNYQLDAAQGQALGDYNVDWTDQLGGDMAGYAGMP